MTIYREQGEAGDVRGDYCKHNHRTPTAAARCKKTHSAAAPQGMWSTASIMASDDGGQTFRKLTEEELSALFDN